MLLRITDALSEGLLDRFEFAARSAKYAAKSKDGAGVWEWSGVLEIAKKVAGDAL